MLVKLSLARPYRPLPPWQAIGARPLVRGCDVRRDDTKRRQRPDMRATLGDAQAIIGPVGDHRNAPMIIGPADRRPSGRKPLSSVDGRQIHLPPSHMRACHASYGMVEPTKIGQKYTKHSPTMTT